MVDINYTSILALTAFAQIIGALWYSPVLFGNLWLKLMNFSKQQLKEIEKTNMSAHMFISLIQHLILIFVLEITLTIMGMNTFAQGFLTGFLLWAGFVLTTMLNSVLWEQKDFKIYLINITHYLVVFTIAGGILGYW